MVTNSSCNYSVKRCLDDGNEDARSLNPLLEPMGGVFTYGEGISGSIAKAVVEHPLTANASYLTMYSGQSAPFRMKSGLELMRAGVKPIVALLDYGDQGGQVLVITDLGIVQADRNGGRNLDFLKNIARYAATRIATRVAPE